MAAKKDFFLFCGNTSNFHFLRSNGILWVTSNMVYKKCCLELPEGLYYLEKVEIRGVSKK